MLRAVLTSLLPVVALAAPPPAPSADLDQLAWLSGCWGAASGDGSEECWLPARGNVMLGMHRDVDGLRVTWEYLRLEHRKAGVFYVASPKGQPTQEFRLVEASGTSANPSATFTNPRHDFPQRLVYERRGDTLVVRASGVVAGKEKRATWTWARQAASLVPATRESALLPSAEVVAAVGAKDRSDEDRALDEGRSPAAWLTFFGVRPAMKVADLGAGGGYTSELLARIVGPAGRVYSQNNKFVVERFAEAPWSLRLKKPVMKNVVRVDREFDAPLPDGAKELDVVVNILFYHDTYWMKTDRDAMNKAIFDALKPGGVYGIVDHSAAEGAGASGVQTLHRVEERLVVDEIQRAGFILEARSEVLRNPEDHRDWNAAPRAAADRRGTSDRFVLLFRKPKS